MKILKILTVAFLILSLTTIVFAGSDDASGNPGPTEGDCTFPSWRGSLAYWVMDLKESCVGFIVIGSEG